MLHQPPKTTDLQYFHALINYKESICPVKPTASMVKEFKNGIIDTNEC